MAHGRFQIPTKYLLVMLCCRIQPSPAQPSPAQPSPAHGPRDVAERGGAGRGVVVGGRARARFDIASPLSVVSPSSRFRQNDVAMVGKTEQALGALD